MGPDGVGTHLGVIRVRTAKAALTGVTVLVATTILASCGVPPQVGARWATESSQVRSTGFGPDFYGVNWDYATAATFAHVNTDPLLAQVDPGTLRWPGGTEADYFVWQTGKPTGKHGQSSFRFTLTDLDNAYRATGATPMFDLNVLAHPTDTTDQIAMLTTAQRMGMPIRYVELGNELYGGGTSGTFARTFHDGTSYGRTVALYVKALHAKFPGVQVAADGSLARTTSREQHWNSEMLATATGAGAPDAVILHDYPGVTYDPFTTADVAPLFATAYTAATQLADAVSALDGKPVWLTEYNFRGPWVPPAKRKLNPVATSYARELYVAELAMLLPRVGHVSLVDYFTAVGGPMFAAWTNPGQPTMTVSGQAVAMIDAAAHGATVTAPVTIAGVPTLPGGYPAVTGQAFTGPGRASATVLVNLGGSPRNVPIGSAIAPNAPYQQITGDPTGHQITAASPTRGTTGTTNLPLPPYSLTLVGATNH